MMRAVNQPVDGRAVQTGRTELPSIHSDRRTLLYDLLCVNSKWSSSRRTASPYGLKAACSFEILYSI